MKRNRNALEEMMEHHRALTEKNRGASKATRGYRARSWISSKRYGGKNEAPAKSTSTKGAPRPDGLPTSPEMIEAVLAEAGNKGLGISALVKAIADKYWPGLITSQIAPTIYELAKKKRILKSDDGVFRRKKG